MAIDPGQGGNARATAVGALLSHRKPGMPKWDMITGMDDRPTRFANRADAGRQLAERLRGMELSDPVIFALPRGGVPVAAEIAAALEAPLDLLLVRKIGAPGNPELAVGAIVEGDPPDVVVNEGVRAMTGADDCFFERAKAAQIDELQRRAARYLGTRARPDPVGRDAIVVDDGLATGATMKAALIALKRRKAARIIIALPVAPRDALPKIKDLADEIVCLRAVERFSGVGAFYDDFHQLSDEEVLGFL